MEFLDIVKNSNGVLSFLTGVVLLVFAGGLGGTLLVRMWTNQIDLSGIVSESDGKASISRLQLLIFTFVIALSLFFIVVGSGEYKFPALSGQILTLLGISGSTALVSKAIQNSSEAGTLKATLRVSPSATGPLAPDATVDLVVSSPSGTALSQVTWSLDAPAHGNIVATSPDKAAYQAPPASAIVGPTEKKVTIRARADGFEDGTATITLA